MCGPEIEKRCAPGVTIQVIEKRTTKRWVVAVHLDRDGRAACGAHHTANGFSTTTVRAEITCQRCLKGK